MPLGNYTTLTPITVPQTTANELTNIPAAALVFKTHPQPTPENLYLTPAAALLWTWHPALGKLLHAAGATQKSALTYTLPSRAGKTHPREINAVLKNTNPNIWHHPDHTPVTWGELSTIFNLPTTNTPPPPVGTSPTNYITITSTTRTITLTLHAPPLIHKTVELTAGTTQRFSLDEIPPLLRALRKTPVTVFTATPTSVLLEIQKQWDRRIVLTPARTAGHARLAVGKHITGLTATARLPLHEAHQLQTKARTQLITHPTTQIGIDLTHPTPVPPPPGPINPKPWQEQFINTYQHIKNLGVINTLPPGCGKTLATLLAWQTANHTRPLVIAPLTLHDTWKTEIRLLHPNVPIHTLTKDKPHPPHGPLITLATPQDAANHQHLLKNIDALCFDEGTYLANPTPTSNRLWELRHALNTPTIILTGTPPAGPKYGQLIKLVLNHPQNHPSVGTKGEHFGPWVFPSTTNNLTEHLPQYTPTLHQLTPDPLTLLVDTQARAYTKELLRQISEATPAQTARLSTQLRNHLDRWRQGLSCPYTLLTGTSQLARRVKTQLPHMPGAPESWSDKTPTVTQVQKHYGPTVKTKWVATHGLAHPGQKLVFGNSTQTLSNLHPLTDTKTTALLTGTQTPQQRTEAAQAYTKKELAALLLSTVGHQGLNLQNTDHVIHLDVPVSYDALTQRTGRAVRIGRTQPVVGHYPVVSGTADVVFWDVIKSGTVQDVFALADKLTKAPPAPVT